MNHDLITPNAKECTWGLRYLLFQLVFLGSFIALAAQLMGIAITAAWLNILYFTINFLAAVVLCRQFLRRTLQSGLRELGRSLQFALVGFGIYQVSILALGSLIILLRPDFANVNDQNLAAISQDHFVLMTVCTVLMVPLTEEVFYRGILFGGLSRRSRTAAYVVSVAAFALVHVSGYVGTTDALTLLLCFLQYLPAGVCLAAVYEKSGSLLPSILIHTAVNAIGMFAMR